MGMFAIRTSDTWIPLQAETRRRARTSPIFRKSSNQRRTAVTYSVPFTSPLAGEVAAVGGGWGDGVDQRGALTTCRGSRVSSYPNPGRRCRRLTRGRHCDHLSRPRVPPTRAPPAAPDLPGERGGENQLKSTSLVSTVPAVRPGAVW